MSDVNSRFVGLAIGAGLLLLAILLAFHFANPRTPVEANRSPSPPTPGGRPPGSEEGAPEADAAPALSTSGAAAAKLALARCLASMSIGRADRWTYYLEAMHGGASPEFKAFARDFLAAAGADVVPLVKSLLAECSSEEAKFLLAAVLGEARRPEAVTVLKDLIGQAPGLQTTAAALYSIGMTRTLEGLDFLRTWLSAARAAESKNLGYLLGPVLSAIGRHGADSIDLLLAEARTRGDATFPSKAEIVGWIRGEDAVERLRRLFESDEDPGVRAGAGSALGSSSNPADLEFLAMQPGPWRVGLALLAPRNLPDVWNATAAVRRQIAERLLSAAAIPTGDARKDSAYLHLATLLPADKVRPLYESLAAADPAELSSDPKALLSRFIEVFGDQPDLDAWIDDLAERPGLPPRELQRAIEIGVTKSALPGKNVASSALVLELLAAVGDPETPRWLVPLALAPVMRSGISEAALSASLQESYGRALTTEAKRTLLEAVIGGAPYQHMGSLQWTQPDGFVASVLRETADPGLKLLAAYAYLVSGAPGSADPGAARAVSDLVGPSLGDLAASPRSMRLVPSVLGAYYARFGTPSDVARLEALPDDFPYPTVLSPEHRTALRDELLRESLRAIDAIRLSSN